MSTSSSSSPADLSLVARKSEFGLPTACPSCLPVYLYLKFANVAFHLNFNTSNPNSDQIPYVEKEDYVAFNNEKGGVIESLKEDGVVDLDFGLPSLTVPDWLSTKAMVSTWLSDAIMYELWLGSDQNAAYKIYFSDLPWPIGKLLHLKQAYAAKQLLGITVMNTDRREAEIYRKARSAYEALSTRLGEQDFFFESRPTSLDAIFLGHALFTLQVLPDTSVLRRKLLEHDNLIRYCEKHKVESFEAGSSVPLSTMPKARVRSSWSTKSKGKPKKEKTPEEKSFRRKAKYFLATQLVAVVLFLTLLGGMADVDVEDEDDGYNYED